MAFPGKFNRLGEELVSRRQTITRTRKYLSGISGRTEMVKNVLAVSQRPLNIPAIEGFCKRCMHLMNPTSLFENRIGSIGKIIASVQS